MAILSDCGRHPGPTSARKISRRSRRSGGSVPSAAPLCLSLCSLVGLWPVKSISRFVHSACIDSPSSRPLTFCVPLFVCILRRMPVFVFAVIFVLNATSLLHWPRVEEFIRSRHFPSHRFYASFLLLRCLICPFLTLGSCCLPGSAPAAPGAARSRPAGRRRHRLARVSRHDEDAGTVGAPVLGSSASHNLATVADPPHSFTSAHSTECRLNADPRPHPLLISLSILSLVCARTIGRRSTATRPPLSCSRPLPSRALPFTLSHSHLSHNIFFCFFRSYWCSLLESSPFPTFLSHTLPFLATIHVSQVRRLHCHRHRDRDCRRERLRRHPHQGLLRAQVQLL